MENQNYITGAMRVLEQGRKMFANEAARGNENTLWETMASCIRGLSRRFVSQPGGEERPMEVTVAEIHNVWFIFTLAASNIDADHPAQDRLVRIILWARETGAANRVNIQNGSTEPVVTSDGQLWKDLPFLVEDVRAAWGAATAYSSSSSTDDPQAPLKARNLAAGVARLAGLGVCGEALTGCALDIMARALGDEKERGTATFTLPQWLSVVEVWLRYGGDKLLMLADQGQAIHPRWSGTGAPGLGAGKQAGEEDGSEAYILNRDTVLRWGQRLSELRSHGEEEISSAAGRCFDMLEWCCLSRYGKGVEAWATGEA